MSEVTTDQLAFQEEIRDTLISIRSEHPDWPPSRVKSELWQRLAISRPLPNRQQRRMKRR